MKKKIFLIIFISLIFLIPIILAFVPIKFTHSKLNTEKECYIVQCVPEGSTDAGQWILIGNNKKELVEDYSGFILNGKNPKDILSYDICNGNTQFIMYGELSKNNNELSNKEVYSLNCYKWEIYYEVRRRKNSLRIPFKNYITVYDLNLFDFLLTDKGY